jgi:hypothetical protein
MSEFWYAIASGALRVREAKCAQCEDSWAHLHLPARDSAELKALIQHLQGVAA